MLIHKDYLELATLAGMHNLPVQLAVLERGRVVVDIVEYRQLLVPRLVVINPQLC